MVKRLGVIFAGLLIVLLLSSINYNAKIQVLAQQNTSVNTNTSAPLTPNVVSNITKLTGGVKIMSPDKGDLVPLNSNQSLVIHGISKDNATSDCDVSVIINNIKPYQNVQPTGAQGANDYSNWQYTVSSNYTNINEGNNKITSKILCLGGPQTLQAYYSVNITATNFTQAQLSSYNMMLESSNSTANGGNMSQVSGGLQQPFAQIQQFNQDTGNGPICCKTTASSSTGSGSGGSSSSSNSNDDDDGDSTSSSSSSNSNDDDDGDSTSSSSSSNSNDDDDGDSTSSSSSSNSNDDDDGDSTSSSSSSNSNDDDDDDSTSSSWSGFSSSNSNDDDDDDSTSSSWSGFSSSNSNDDDDGDSTSSSWSGFSSSNSNDDDDGDSTSSSSSSNSNDDDDGVGFSNRIGDSDFGYNFDDRNDDSSGSSNSGVEGILDNVEDTMRSVGIDLSFN
ncbi:hypothetical protein [Candidatus Nitrosocosmicus sp. T]